MSEPFTTLTSRTLVLPEANIDTDRIIPARFLTTTERAGLGAHAFEDARAADPHHPLNAPDAGEHQILVAGENFGCGSSREHAPWALSDFGFRAVLSSSFADIFRGNALKNGLVALEIPAELHAALLARPGLTVTIDLEARTVQLGNEPPVSVDIEPFARTCLLEGVDQLGFLLGREDAIAAFEAKRSEG
ncbi:MAG: 3-isopropylmalate dehydratase small subunit [Caulobacterales bacterium]|nr:3-isopropylmalate dehydratase small subunit [Caulobacterales bacterium]